MARGDKGPEDWAEEEVKEPQHHADAAATGDPDGLRTDSAPRMSDEDVRGDIHYDLHQAFQAIKGERAPQPLHAESSRHYLLRGLRALQRFSDDYKRIGLKRCRTTPSPLRAKGSVRMCSASPATPLCPGDGGYGMGAPTRGGGRGCAALGRAHARKP
jgi:hypothetical protein